VRPGTYLRPATVAARKYVEQVCEQARRDPLIWFLLPIPDQAEKFGRSPGRLYAPAAESYRALFCEFTGERRFPTVFEPWPPTGAKLEKVRRRIVAKVAADRQAASPASDGQARRRRRLPPKLEKRNDWLYDHHPASPDRVDDDDSREIRTRADLLGKLNKIARDRSWRKLPEGDRPGLRRAIDESATRRGKPVIERGDPGRPEKRTLLRARKSHD
jgi:hypothetical protein